MKVAIPKAVLWGGIIASLPYDGDTIDESCLENVRDLLLDVAYSCAYVAEKDISIYVFTDCSELVIVDPFQTKGCLDIKVQGHLEIEAGDEE